jgi:class 3 adenylate cyclase
VTDLTGPGRARLQALLKEYNEYPERQQEIDAQIHEEFCKEVAVVVIDSCGFSRTVRQHGIVNFLARLERLERMIAPMIDAHGGRLLRAEADNLFALFGDADSAVEFAAEVQRNVGIANDPLPAASEIYVAIGVGFGRMLLIDDNDVFGDEMNVACKLGEDLAEQGEVLLTADAFKALKKAASWTFESSSVRISGLDLALHKLVV